MQAGEHFTGMLGWTRQRRSGRFLHTLLGDSAKTNGSNVAKFCFQPFEDLVLKAKTISDKQRTELYRRPR